MDARRECKTSQSKGCPWIPTTPAKPDSTRHQPVCSIWQESPHVQSSWLEPGILTRVNQITQPKCSSPGRLPGEFLAEAPNQTAYGGFNAWPAGAASSSGSHVYRDPLQSLGTWQAGEHNNSHVYRADFLMDNKLTVDESEAWNDMPFGSLLALAGNPPVVAAVQNAVRQADFAATNTTIAPHFQPHQMLSFGNSSVHELDSLLGDNSTHHIFGDGSSKPSRPFFDLNSPPKPIAHAAFSKSILFQFEPITPEKTNKADNTQETNTHNPSTNCEPLARDAQENTGNGEVKERQKMIKEPNVDQLCANTLTQEQENNEPDKRGADEADLIKTPQQKPRRRKHRPKVVIEGKTKTTSKPRGRPPSVSEDTRLKMTYVQRKRANNPTNSPSEWVYNGTVDKGLADPSITRSTRNSCRKSLNFSEGLEGDQTCIKGKCQMVFSYVTREKEANTVQMASNPDSQWTPLDDSICSSTDLMQERRARGLKRQHTSTSAEAEVCSSNSTGTLNKFMKNYLSILSLSASTYGMHFPTIYKKKRTEKKFSAPSSSWQSTMTASDKQIKHERNTPSDSFKHQLSQKTNQGSSFASKTSNLLMINTAAHGTKMGQQNFEDLLVLGSRQTTVRRRSKGHTGQQISEDLLALGSRETITRKRSKGHTRGRDLASLVEMCKKLPFSPSGAARTSRTEQRNKIPHELDTCVQALVADKCPTPRTKKRSKRALFVNPTVQYFFNHQEFSSTSAGPPLALKWKSTSQINYIIDQLSQLDLNAEISNVSIQIQKGLMPYQKHHHEQCALVTYQRDGMLVPFDQFRRKKRRPQVDLDEETTRVWKLLLEDINSEGIDGTNDEKTKWWEEERKVFHGRADSFIARMHLIQGDRRFSPWKGSVVDSVVGVFLTQNVSDHLSSSAFMALAAHFPLISSINTAEFPEASLHAEAGEPEVCVLDTNETAELNEKIILEPIHCSDSRMLHNFEDDEIIVSSPKSFGKSSDHNVTIDNLSGQMPDMPNSDPVMSCESAPNNSASFTENGLEMDDALSPQTSVIYSQNSPDSLNAQTNEIIESCSLSNSEEQPAAEVKPNNFTSSTSFAKLLQRAGTVLHGVYGKGRDTKESDENHQAQPESLALKSQNEYHFINPVPGDMSCTESSLCMGSSSGANAGWLDSSNKYCKFSDTSSGGLRTAEISGVSAESVSQTRSSHDKIETNKTIVEKQTGLLEAHNLLQESGHKKQHVTDVAIRRNIGKSRTHERKFVNDPDYSNKSKSKGGRTKKEKNQSNKSKGGRTKKEKNQPVDWDQLRRHAEDGGRKREKTVNTMDSVDWDAVRCTDVEEIAESIKERGMNNMLAERIKAFLNRLVRDHGSIDLEWLRDVPPDKAKEYLLSFTGLGLKSVECVRLLTLHHLAFPVDTNVGRIAVRLGWVPLQPLPESLQLHLLELYPVLETIQKYLWPRLCKLDQRTLYELHYQLITFGKVFCTKRKPNCNACPMRGECRHFASEFASARLALPAPDEKRIVPAAENKATGEVPTRGMNILQLSSPLPLPEEKSIVSAGEIKAASQYSTRGFNSSQVPSFQANAMKMKSGVSNSQPIIEEPATPEPIIEKPTTPVPECDIEDIFCEDPDEIPTIQFDMEQFTQNLQNVMQNTEVHEADMSKALVALTPEAASLPMPKLKNVSRLRTEHRVYELPDSHPLLNEVDKREPDDPSPYLLAIWTPGETVNSIEPPERRCGSQESGKLCTDETCVSCNSTREQDSQTVRGTLLIPCRTAMKGSFPLNGTYFQVNEVFSDHKSSLTPIDVPRRWLWNLPRRTVFFGTSIPTIFKGLTTEGIQYCFWRGFVCVRGFDRESRVPRPLITRLHFPPSKLARGKGKNDDN